jgi:hypothetical protein
MHAIRSAGIGLLLGAAIWGQTKTRAVPAPKPPPVNAQPFGLKGDILGESIEEFRAKNDRSITLGQMGRDRASITPDLATTKHLPQCTNDHPDGNVSLSPDVQSDYETAEEKRAGVVKCIASLSIDDDLDYEDSPTIAGVEAYRTVYYFFRDRLYMIKSTLPGKSYPELRNTFVEKYGAPIVSVAQYQNLLGAKLDGEKLLWKTDLSQINIGQRDGEPDDPTVTQAKDIQSSIMSTRARTAAIGKGYEATKTATVYGQVLSMLRSRHREELAGSNVLITIWHTALRKECETAGSVDRKKDV